MMAGYPKTFGRVCFQMTKCGISEMPELLQYEALNGFEVTKNKAGDCIWKQASRNDIVGLCLGKIVAAPPWFSHMLKKSHIITDIFGKCQGCSAMRIQTNDTSLWW